MAEACESGTQLSFKVKTSGEGLHNITIAETATVLDLKSKLSGPDYENVPVDRMRLIYAGRVMKNEEPLTTYKIKAGNTVHMVKSAASNTAATASSTASNTSSSRPAQPAVPTNMAAGTSANNPLDHLTGARYAGMIPGGLPGASMFGPDGGMGAPPSSDDMFNMMSNPQMQQMMNEMLNNPAAVDMMIQSNPMLRNMPNAREMIQSPMFRHMMTNPESIRSAMRLRSMMAGGGMGGAPSAFPAPGATNTTPDGAASTPSSGNTGSQRGEGGTNPNAANPFASLLNPALFGSDSLFNPFGAQAPPYARHGAAASTGASQGQTGASGATSAAPGASGAAAAASPAGSAPSDGAPTGSQPPNNAPPVNPFAALFGLPAGAGAPGSPPPDLANLLQALGGLTGGTPQAPPDNRPPEERYEQQLRQLNDMGFYDFDANVAALRRSGGSVQGAIEHLLNSP